MLYQSQDRARALADALTNETVMPVEMPRLWTESEVAAYLGVNPETVARERGVGFAQKIAAHSDPRMTQSYVSGVARVAI